MCHCDVFYSPENAGEQHYTADRDAFREHTISNTPPRYDVNRCWVVYSALQLGSLEDAQKEHMDETKESK